MTSSETGPAPVVESWDKYWRVADSNAAFTAGGSGHPAVLSFWGDFFASIRSRGDALRFIDIASGNGAVIERAREVLAGDWPDFTCLDVSAAAIEALSKRFGGVRGIVADATAIPLESGSFDVATSQFGIEYAGDGAMGEVARLIAPTGKIAALMHHRGSSIYQQCLKNRDAITETLDANFIPYARALFKAGFDSMEIGNRADYNAAGENFGPAIRTMESIMRQHGRDVADGTIVRLYRDVRNITTRLRHYEASEVLDWLTRMDGEMRAYAGRMSSMCNAAVDARRFEDFCSKLAAAGFDILQRDALESSGDDLPIAWALIAERR